MADLLTDAETRIDPPHTVLGPRDAGVPMTFEEFDAADGEKGHRYELIHGVLVVTPAPAEEHRDANDELGYMLRTYRERPREGGSLDWTLPEQEVRTGKGVRRCDRAIWAGLGRRPQPKRDVPTIVVEFVSSGTWSRRRDYIEKRDEYLALGIKEYWIVDRFARRMTVLTNNGNLWVEAVVPADGVYESSLLPGFKLKPTALLATAD